MPPLNGTPDEGKVFHAYLQVKRSETYLKAVNSMSKSD